MPTDLKSLIVIFLDLIEPLIALLAGLSLLAFFWGLASFIFKSGDTKAIEEGKALMKWGLIALFVMVSVWGIIGFFSGSFGFGTEIGFPFLPQ